MSIHLERRHSIVLAGPVDHVFPLFTPIGETKWVEDWNPYFIHPASGETCEGMVFRTGEGEDLTLWSCILWSPSDYHARYARVTPSSRFGFVDVACCAESAERTRATITYDYTALTASGQAYLASLTQDAFVDMIEGWRTCIDRLLAQ